jgi:CIC family chloride channel protein
MHKGFSQWAQTFRHRLASADALSQLSLLAIFTGLFTSGIVILFRLAMELPLSTYLPSHGTENFEDLPLLWRILLPLLGTTALSLFFWRRNKKKHAVGITHVMQRMNYHQGNLPIGNAVTQFVGGVITVISGLSAGREGPAIHLGAASGSVIGQWLKLPNNSLRILVACGVAAAISASFNTPIAGVIFSMEVILLEYSIIGFTPVIVASVTGAVFTRMVFGHEPAFNVPALNYHSHWELGFVVLLGMWIGSIAALFTGVTRQALKISHWPLSLRFLIVGVSTAVLAIFLPQVMGIGYDSVDSMLVGEMGLMLCLGLLLGKLLLTAMGVGLGLPGGLIGPSFVFGAAAGACLGYLVQWIMPSNDTEIGFYAMLGMGAMMGAILNAPLAALMALLELTNNPHIILPGMLCIVNATLIYTEVFKQRSVFRTILNFTGLDYNDNPVVQALRRTSVSSIMDKSIVAAPRTSTLKQLQTIMLKQPRWVAIQDQGQPSHIMPAIDLATLLASDDLLAQYLHEDNTIDLLAIPAERKSVSCLYVQATLQEALDQLEKDKVDILCIRNMASPMINPIKGRLSRDDINNFYHYKT